LEGERNNHLFKLGCKLVRERLDVTAVQFALYGENLLRCKPALDENEVTKIAKSACKRAAPGKDGETPKESKDDPHRLARLYIAEQCEHLEGQTLRRWRDQWYRWDGTAYRVVSDGEMTGELTVSVKCEYDRLNIIAQKMTKEGKDPPTVRKVTRGLISNVDLALGSMTCWPGAIEPPQWWDGKGWQHRNLIPLANGLLDLDKLFAEEGDVLLPHTPRWFSFTSLPYPYDPTADCPSWKKFLERNLEGDVERIALLQEWFGYCLTPDTSQQKFLLIEGDGGNGKSVACAALEATLGSDNCSHVPLELFGHRFQLEATLGKLANIAAEVGELDKAAEGYLKAFTSGDTMEFERKYKSAFSAFPSARLVLATNNRPRFSDKSGGVWRRMLLMPFQVKIDDDDPSRVSGMDKPTWWVESGELPGIFNWALEGYRHFLEQGWFTKSEICTNALTEYRTESNPARLFLTETCGEKPDAKISCDLLYKLYSRWCTDNGYQALGERTFGKEVRRIFPKVERRYMGRRGAQSYQYCGLSSIDVGGVPVTGQSYINNQLFKTGGGGGER
jgi:P4 family phage/plasmid primase-like protien